MHRFFKPVLLILVIQFFAFFLIDHSIIRGFGRSLMGHPSEDRYPFLPHTIETKAERDSLPNKLRPASHLTAPSLLKKSIRIPDKYEFILDQPFYVYDELIWLDATVDDVPLTQMIHDHYMDPQSEDLWFLLAAMSHPQRTNNPAKAVVFVIPTLLNMVLAFDSSFCWEGLCGMELVHYTDRFLDSSVWFHRRQGADHIVVATHDSASHSLPSYPTLVKCHMIGIANRHWNNADRRMMPSYSVGTPCPDSSDGRRPNDFSLVASMPPSKPFSSRRNVCEWMLTDRPQYRMNACGQRPKCSTVMDARFGFNFPGESIGSSQLMDLLLSNTVPVFTAEDQLDALPEWIDWSKISYVANLTDRNSFLLSVDSMVSDNDLYHQKHESLMINRDLFDWTSILPFDTYMYMLVASMKADYKREDLTSPYSALRLPSPSTKLPAAAKQVFCTNDRVASSCAECPLVSGLQSRGCSGMCHWCEYGEDSLESAEIGGPDQCVASHKICREPNTEEIVQRLSRAAQPWAGERYEWCLEEDENDDSIHGLLLAKTYKTASTTAAAVSMHIAERVGKRKGLLSGRCVAHTSHKFSRINLPRFRESPSILWTTVRDPVKRGLSAFSFYLAGRLKIPPTDANVIHFLESVKNHQFVQLRTKRGKSADGGFPTNQQIEDSNHAVGRILQEEIMPLYDFIAVTERMEESLVVLKLLWGLEDGDIIVSSAKQAGGWSHNWDPLGECFDVPKLSASRVVKEYLSTQFNEGNADFVLHSVANRSLDLTIDALGRDRVNEELRRHKKLTALVAHHCQSNVTFPCSDEGIWQESHVEDCYEDDIGCGHRCIDDVLDKYEKGEFVMTRSS